MDVSVAIKVNSRDFGMLIQVQMRRIQPLGLLAYRRKREQYIHGIL